MDENKDGVLDVVKSNKNYILIACGVVLVIALLFVFRKLPNLGGESDKVRQQPDTAADQQQRVTESLGTIEQRLRDSEREVERLTRELNEATEANTRIIERSKQSQRNLTRSSDLLEDCQRVLKQVREDGQKDD